MKDSFEVARRGVAMLRKRLILVTHVWMNEARRRRPFETVCRFVPLHAFGVSLPAGYLFVRCFDLSQKELTEASFV